MRRSLSLFIALVLFAASFACSSRKPPEQAYVRSRNVLSVLREMGQSYENRDIGSFMDHIAPSYPDRDDLEKAVAGVFAKYEAIRFDIQYTKMIIFVAQQGPIKATFTWSGSWKTAGGTGVTDGGRVTLVLDPKSFRLLSIDGKNPFLARPGKTPGK